MLAGSADLSRRESFRRGRLATGLVFDADPVSRRREFLSECQAPTMFGFGRKWFAVLLA